MLNRQRGQTMVYWLVATVLAITMLLFAGNYETMMAWQIHAQNAADSATSVALSPTANVLNEESTLLYAAAISEYRLRYLNQGLLNAINHVGCTNNCATIYAKLLPAYDNAVNSFDESWQLLQRANNFTEGGQQADEKAALAKVGTFDPAFTYTVLASPAPGKKNGAVRTVDIITCKTMSYFAPGIFGLKTPSYQVIGRSAASTQPVALASSTGSYSENFSPSSINSVTGQPWQPNEDPANSGLSPYYVVDYAPLTVNLDWFSTAAIAPFAQGSGGGGSLQPGDYGC